MNPVERNNTALHFGIKSWSHDSASAGQAAPAPPPCLPYSLFRSSPFADAILTLKEFFKTGVGSHIKDIHLSVVNLAAPLLMSSGTNVVRSWVWLKCAMPTERLSIDALKGQDVARPCLRIFHQVAGIALPGSECGSSKFKVLYPRDITVRLNCRIGLPNWVAENSLTSKTLKKRRTRYATKIALTHRGKDNVDIVGGCC